jgi:DNA-binding XRE family transcriptional regulator
LSHERILLEAWGDVIRRYRQWQGLSRRELAHRAGLSAVFLGEAERGEKDLSSHSICLLADALGVPLPEFLMRVAAQLEGQSPSPYQVTQTSIPRVVREGEGDGLQGVSPAKDETAFDLYNVVRRLRSDQQVSLLVLAQSLVAES